MSAQADAYRIAKAARRRGDLVPTEACEDCGRMDKPLSAHFADYNHPLDVRWLDRSCLHIRQSRERLLADPVKERQRRSAASKRGARARARREGIVPQMFRVVGT